MRELVFFATVFPLKLPLSCFEDMRVYVEAECFEDMRVYVIVL